ncbi:unnamed protein product [Trypanosoma congolense IL3000]|uniref:WGS project CAEQ00000000 data, annotated contig 1144 n=1 Tax=Trypanosoma congolense (strain IL3000) TaxID=1068625 RepID=F9W444_TRYCI|nr:unnamed protein product [Trypanosoma congolense IL3000]
MRWGLHYRGASHSRTLWSGVKTALEFWKERCVPQRIQWKTDLPRELQRNWECLGVAWKERRFGAAERIISSMTYVALLWAFLKGFREQGALHHMAQETPDVALRGALGTPYPNGKRSWKIWVNEAMGTREETTNWGSAVEACISCFPWLRLRGCNNMVVEAPIEKNAFRIFRQDITGRVSFVFNFF